MKLNNDNYFSVPMRRAYMSVSQFKAFERCEAAAMANIRGRYEVERTVPMLVGSYVDAYFEGKLDRFCADNPDLFKRDGSLKSEFIAANDIIRRIERDRLMKRYLGGEKQVVMTGEISGVPVKIKVDSLLRNKIVDLKVMRDFEDIYVAEKGGRVPWFEAWGYVLQGAVYQEIVRQNTGKKLPFFLAAATKEKVPDIDIVEIVQPMLDEELERFKRDVVYYDSIKQGLVKPERCGHCDYCKATKVIKAPRKSDEIVL